MGANQAMARTQIMPRWSCRVFEFLFFGHVFPVSIADKTEKEEKRECACESGVCESGVCVRAHVRAERAIELR